ncbi:MAG: ABC transporter permease [Bacteroidales bacterium]|nr:ABC transporter permease [Bacteroidales bacterium]
MFKHIIKITLRNYRKNLLFTLIIVFGLAISMATILVITRYVIHEYSMDKFHRAYNNIFLLMNIASDGNSSTVKQDWAEKIRSSYPEVKEVCRIDRIEFNVIQSSGPIRLKQILSTDPSFFNIFSFPVIQGDSANPLPDLQSIVITESTASKLFGTDESLGKTVKIKLDDKEELLTVTAITKDPPSDSRIQFEALVSFENKSFHYRMMSFSSMKKGIHQVIYMCDIYLLIQPKANIPSMDNRLKNESYREMKEDGFFSYLKFHPYSEVYFDKTQTDSFKHGDKAMLFVFSSLAFLLILLACINYINLTTIKAFSRTREIGYKKVSGASRKILTLQFLFESVGLSVIAFIFGIFLSKYLASMFSKLVNSGVDVTWFFGFPQLLWVLLFMLILGLISGYYPSLYLSRIKTSELFNSRSMTNKHILLLPKNLFIFQFTIAITLIISAMVIEKQLNFINTKDLGFDKNNILHLTIPGEIKPFALKSELMNSPGISNITLSYGTPAKLAATDGKYWFISTDTSFIPTFGIRILKGRNFAPGDKNVCLVNETLMKENKWEDFRGKRTDNGEIIGVVQDFHTSSLYEKIVPVEIDFNTSFLFDMSIKLNGADTKGTLDFIKATWKKMAPYSPMEYYFYDDWIGRQYKKDEAFARLISVFTFIAILISCLGLFGLLVYVIERRAKEIGIRKINGAETLEILVMLNKDFLKWVAIAFVIAAPIAWLLLYKWLQNFAYKTRLNGWFFLLAGLISVAIALLTVSWKSWLAARRNPAEVLREE